jgi:hypothetical protein
VSGGLIKGMNNTQASLPEKRRRAYPVVPDASARLNASHVCFGGGLRKKVQSVEKQEEDEATR